MSHGSCRGPARGPPALGQLARGEWMWGVVASAGGPPLPAWPPVFPQALPCSREGLSRRPDFPQPVPSDPLRWETGKTLSPSSLDGFPGASSEE